MSEEWPKPWQVRWFDTLLVTLLIAASCLRASMSEGGFVLSLLHGLFLVLGFILVSILVRRLHSVFADALLGFIALLLIAELAVQYFTALHVNWFLISLLLQPDTDTQIGFSGEYALLVVIAVLAAVIWTGRKTHAWLISVRPALVLAAAAGVFVTAQWVYTVAYFDGAAHILETRRTLPFFWAPHPYRSNKLLGYVFGPRGDNPFSIAHPQDDKQPIANTSDQIPSIDLNNAPNILLIVADSWRAKDLVESPEIAPHFMRAGASGYLSLGHSSVSNCTHFSMYSLFTGKLATGYGRSRRLTEPVGLLPTLSAVGFEVSTAESVAMDWYNLSDMILPADAERVVANGEDNYETDQHVTRSTVKKIETWRHKEKPQLHLAFYQGTHYPYHEGRARPGATNLERYKMAITALDTELAVIFSALGANEAQRETLVIITSDHGEEFLDEGVVGHASRLTEEQVTVPFMVLGGSPHAAVPQSHIGVRDFIMTEMGLLSRPEQTQPPQILANCDYDHPNGFALLTEQGRFEFIYDDGYLVPTSDTSTSQEKNEIAKAAKKLLRVITEAR